MSNQQKIGIYSGTFDPVHVGHVAFALQAAKILQLKGVYFLPEPQPREKNNITPLPQRVEMLQLALDQHQQLHVLAPPDQQFTVAHTLPYIRQQFVGYDLVYLCGSDVVRTFTYRWEGLADLLATTELVVGLRGGDTAADVRKIIESVSSVTTYHTLRTHKHHLASTDVRSGHHKIKDVHPAVAAYILQHRLYS